MAGNYLSLLRSELALVLLLAFVLQTDRVTVGFLSKRIGKTSCRFTDRPRTKNPLPPRFFFFSLLISAIFTFHLPFTSFIFDTRRRVTCCQANQASLTNTMAGITLHTNGFRVNKPDKAEVDLHLARWRTQVQGDNVVEKLDMSCRSWDRPVLDNPELLDFLEKHVVPTIRVLKIDDIIASLPTEQGLATLAFFHEVFKNAPRLDTIHLDDNALGTRGVEKIKDLLNKETVRNLTLCNCGLSEEVFEALRVALSDTMGQIVHIALGRNQAGPGGARQVGEFMLPSMKNLQHFLYNGSRPLGDGSKLICAGLDTLTEEHPNLITLDLNDSQLNDGSEGDHAVHAASRAIARCSNLKVLNLPDCALAKEGLMIILDALYQSNATLTGLDLSGNELQADGAEILADYLIRKGGDLKTLVLEGNQFELDGIEHLLPFLRQVQHLETLDFSSNLLEADSGWLLARNQIPSLQTLVLKDNGLSVGGVRCLRGMYKTVETDPDDELEEDDADNEHAADEDVGDLSA